MRAGVEARPYAGPDVPLHIGRARQLRGESEKLEVRDSRLFIAGSPIIAFWRSEKVERIAIGAALLGQPLCNQYAAPPVRC